MKIVSSCIYDLKIKSRMDEIKTVTVEFLSFLFLFHNCFILNLKKYTSISCNDVGMFHFDTFMNYNLIFHLILLADHENSKLSLNKGILIKRKIEYYSLKLHVCPLVKHTNRDEVKCEIYSCALVHLKWSVKVKQRNHKHCLRKKVLLTLVLPIHKLSHSNI